MVQMRKVASTGYTVPHRCCHLHDLSDPSHDRHDFETLTESAGVRTDERYLEYLELEDALNIVIKILPSIERSKHFDGYTDQSTYLEKLSPSYMNLSENSKNEI